MVGPLNWAIIIITFFLEKLNGKDLEYESRSQFRTGMWCKVMIELCEMCV